ncbi:uncharacterized protein [Pseudorasbora parva]|uniref:uncharacterized protein isoform X2 n=1 Tax=Pseudorasbora parva TaxID=51549 RepID=UPI00351DE04C
MFKEKTHVFFWLYYCRLIGVFGDELKSVMEGESVTLQINVTELQTDDEILWTFGTKGPLIAKTNGVTNSFPDDVLDGRFRDRLELDQKTGSLTITDISTELSGVYEAEISLSSSVTKHRFNVTVYATTTPDPPSTSDHPSGSPSDPPSLIVPIAAAAAGSLLIVAAVGIIWICRKQRKTDQEEETAETREEEITYAAPTFLKIREQKPEDEVIYAGVVTRR